MKNKNQDWQNLARLASKEQDPERLLELIHRLNNALEMAENPALTEATSDVDPSNPGDKMSSSAA